MPFTTALVKQKLPEEMPTLIMNSLPTLSLKVRLQRRRLAPPQPRQWRRREGRRPLARLRVDGQPVMLDAQNSYRFVPQDPGRITLEAEGEDVPLPQHA